ncbi:PIN domain-containing protein [Rasiella sp. SM2506]|uniref:PIN domain-containing protein n=1 Tax=Rasiella sp. SM2506 TaxID=3423914 RepID=UPI003D7ABC7F
MIYITLDTCVWLGLIKIDLHKDNSVFEEICYWIENKHLTHITPENIIREWDRHKLKNASNLKNTSKSYYSSIQKQFQGNTSNDSTFISTDLDSLIDERINRVEKILKYFSEQAKENQNIYKEATKKILNCIAPNHSKESFRDTVIILTLTHYLTSKGYTNNFFSTINYTDFSESKSQKHELHHQLSDDFKNANLQYVYCDESPFASKLLGISLRPILPNFQNYLKEKKREEDAKVLADKKDMVTTPVTSPDADYLENIKHLDLILAKKTPTSWEQDMVKSLIGRHDSYKQYFFNNIGNNGLV